MVPPGATGIPRQVFEALKATGSSDPDVLYARKEELLSATRRGIWRARSWIVAGAALSLSGIGLIFGVPMIRRGLSGTRRISAEAAEVEASFRSYLELLVAKRSVVVIAESIEEMR